MLANKSVRAYIGLGSNLNNPVSQLQQALQAIANIPITQLSKISSFYQTSPMGPQDQPDFINAAVEIQTNLSALALLKQLQAIEQRQARQRQIKWGPRTIDLDLLLYGDWLMQTAELILPHPGISQRDFVLYPLYELAPDLKLPCGKTIKRLLDDNKLNPTFIKPILA